VTARAPAIPSSVIGTDSYGWTRGDLVLVPGIRPRGPWRFLGWRQSLVSGAEWLDLIDSHGKLRSIPCDTTLRRAR